FGWAKPVIVDPTRFKNPRRDMMWVALAGPAANLLLAFVMARVYPFLVTGLPANWAWAVRGFFQVTITLNIWLAVFNLLPLPPLDGSKVLAGLVPRRWAFRLYNLETYGTVVLLLLIVSGMVSRVLWPAYRAVAWLILGGGRPGVPSAPGGLRRPAGPLAAPHRAAAGGHLAGVHGPSGRAVPRVPEPGAGRRARGSRRVPGDGCAPGAHQGPPPPACAKGARRTRGGRGRPGSGPAGPGGRVPALQGSCGAP